MCGDQMFSVIQYIILSCPTLSYNRIYYSYNFFFLQAISSCYNSQPKINHAKKKEKLAQE